MVMGWWQSLSGMGWVTWCVAPKAYRGMLGDPVTKARVPTSCKLHLNKGREGGTRGRGYGDICICIADSLCYTAETNTTL